MSYQSSIQLLNIWRRMTHTYHGLQRGQCYEDCFNLNRAIFEKMSDIASRHRAEFLIVYLPAYSETIDNDVDSFGQAFYEDYQKGHTNYFLNPRASIVAAPFEKAKGHYQIHETDLVSQLIYNKIQTLPSWQHEFGAKP